MNIGRPKLMVAALALAGLMAGGPVSAVEAQMSQAEAARFLTHASFGPSTDSINEMIGLGKEGWLSAQFGKEQTMHLGYISPLNDALKLANVPGHARADQAEWFESFWRQAIGHGTLGQDQLRQRVAFALSQIFVVSFNSGAVFDKTLGVADYYDRLGQHSFGNFRDLLETVALHPMMGRYLSHIRNQKESDQPGNYRVPDENFAREIMQLMTIGLYELNQDGSQKLGSNGKPIETYTHDHVAGLAKVFTGWSWYNPVLSDANFYGNDLAQRDPAHEVKLMSMYPQFHSTSEKSFLGKTIAANGSGESDLKEALDHLFHHDNVGPFISRQLIQRLVSSNPSPGYISDVAAVFNNNGDNVRGDMKSVIRAILLHPEARQPSATTYKLREPIIRITNWARAFKAIPYNQDNSKFSIPNTDDPLLYLGQSPMRSPSVFNFYRPSYSPPKSHTQGAGQVAPELQIVSEPAVAGYVNMMVETIRNGFGNPIKNGSTVLAPHALQTPYADQVALAHDPVQLINNVKLLLTSDTMSDALRDRIVTAVGKTWVPSPAGASAETILAQKLNRVCLAIFLTMTSPEYLVQK